MKNSHFHQFEKTISMLVLCAVVSYADPNDFETNKYYLRPKPPIFTVTASPEIQNPISSIGFFTEQLNHLVVNKITGEVSSIFFQKLT
jgi:hypothetical protein